VNNKLAPDTHTPVVVGNRVFGSWRRLHCLDLKNSLKPIWDANDLAFNKSGAIVATPQRLLVMTLEAEFILVDETTDENREIGRMKTLPAEKGLDSHPAFVDRRVYLRKSSSLLAVELG
jgi:outer membrane protein assembly factor BamB